MCFALIIDGQLLNFWQCSVNHCSMNIGQNNAGVHRNPEFACRPDIYIVTSHSCSGWVSAPCQNQGGQHAFFDRPSVFSSFDNFANSCALCMREKMITNDIVFCVVYNTVNVEVTHSYENSIQNKKFEICTVRAFNQYCEKRNYCWHNFTEARTNFYAK